MTDRRSLKVPRLIERCHRHLNRNCSIKRKHLVPAKYRPGICVCERRIPHFFCQEFPLFCVFLTFIVYSLYQGNRFVSYDGFSKRYVKYLLHLTRLPHAIYLRHELASWMQCCCFIIIKVLFLTHINNANMIYNPFRWRVDLNFNRSTFGLVQCSIQL